VVRQLLRSDKRSTLYGNSAALEQHAASRTTRHLRCGANNASLRHAVAQSGALMRSARGARKA